MKYQSKIAMQRMKIRLQWDISENNPEVLKTYLLTFDLPFIRYVFTSLNISMTNNIFHCIINDAPALIAHICKQIVLEGEKEVFSRMTEFEEDFESNSFNKGSIAWLKKDIEACHFFWWSLMTLEWDFLFKKFRSDNFRACIPEIQQQSDSFVYKSLGIPCVVSGHIERYKIITRILKALPFKSTEVDMLISHISFKYHRGRRICRNEVNLSSLMKDKNSVSFSIDYLLKKKRFNPELIPVTESDNKIALITQLYLLTDFDEFNKIATSLTKAWSQKKIRDSRKEVATKKPVEYSMLSSKNRKILKTMSEKEGMSQSELINYAVELLDIDLRGSSK